MAAVGLSRCVIPLHHCLLSMYNQSILNSATLRGVHADKPLSYALLAYLLRWYIFDYTTISSDVRHCYPTFSNVNPIIYINRFQLPRCISMESKLWMFNKNDNQIKFSLYCTVSKKWRKTFRRKKSSDKTCLSWYGMVEYFCFEETTNKYKS